MWRAQQCGGKREVHGGARDVVERRDTEGSAEDSDGVIDVGDQVAALQPGVGGREEDSLPSSERKAVLKYFQFLQANRES